MSALRPVMPREGEASSIRKLIDFHHRHWLIKFGHAAWPGRQKADCLPSTQCLLPSSSGCRMMLVRKRAGN
jgi:hypothetical protein